jgi:hypothetical protein
LDLLPSTAAHRTSHEGVCVVEDIDDPIIIRTILYELHIPRTRAPRDTGSASPTTPHCDVMLQASASGG